MFFRLFKIIIAIYIQELRKTNHLRLHSIKKHYLLILVILLILTTLPFSLDHLVLTLFQNSFFKYLSLILRLLLNELSHYMVFTVVHLEKRLSTEVGFKCRINASAYRGSKPVMEVSMHSNIYLDSSVNFRWKYLCCVYEETCNILLFRISRSEIYRNSNDTTSCCFRRPLFSLFQNLSIVARVTKLKDTLCKLKK